MAELFFLFQDHAHKWLPVRMLHIRLNVLVRGINEKQKAVLRSLSAAFCLTGRDAFESEAEGAFN